MSQQTLGPLLSEVNDPHVQNRPTLRPGHRASGYEALAEVEADFILHPLHLEVAVNDGADLRPGQNLASRPLLKLLVAPVSFDRILHYQHGLERERERENAVNQI